ncbi:ATP synthase subunit f, mitochondrial isoform X2 [Clarias gariepinus]|uniref:ATP synthase subunit f, mitochondrial isoform X2 n=1 Tax=Clarias gariepinus TaxID=13013 RepID=UPI00234C83EE|nr:ATP synthase subunit f, mitochondrial isoform X2 [Clarias gariepinus]
MSLETCPFCGKAFKRLRSHLPHCKMSPGLKTVQMTDNTLKETPDPTFKHTGDKDKTSPVTQLRLGDVRLNELASWYGAHSPKSPKEALTIVNKGWQWYYRKYIDVQKGGFGGIAMLIGSYCVLSYIWNYPNIKKHRWRKYH